MLRNLGVPKVRKSLMSEILEPEVAAPVLWAPGMFCSFCWKTRAKMKKKNKH